MSKFVKIKERERLLIYKNFFSRVANNRDILPHCIWVSDGLLIMHYKEPNKWERIGLRLFTGGDITLTWSEIQHILHQFIGDKAFLEVYPTAKETLDGAPVRWFWRLPHALPKEINLVAG